VLKRRIATIEEMKTEVAVWEVDRNQATKTVHWQFKTEDARIKLKWLYPKI